MVRNRKSQGFTLVEILVVVMVISMLAVFVVPRVFKNIGGAKRDIAKAKMAVVEKSIGTFYFDCDRWPESLDDLFVAPDGLDEKWQGAYLKRTDILDPWGKPYLYVAEGEVNVNSFDLISFGADGVEGGVDANADIIND